MDDRLLEELRATPGEACFTEVFNRNRGAVLIRCRRMPGAPAAEMAVPGQVRAVLDRLPAGRRVALTCQPARKPRHDSGIL
jgi:hypothetical protein